MKKFALLLSLMLVAGVVSAGDKKHHAAKNANAAAAAGLKAAPVLSAEIVSVDATAKTVSFKSEKGENVTWPVDAAALATLKNLKAGEKVTIAYSVDEKGAPKAALDIKALPTKAAAKK